MAQDIDKLEGMRRRVPVIAGQLAEVVVDNPAQCAAVAAGALVLTRIMVNLARPRTPVEAIAVLITCQVAGSWLAVKACESGLLQFRLRGPDGELRPAFPADA